MGNKSHKRHAKRLKKKRSFKPIIILFAIAIIFVLYKQNYTYKYVEEEITIETYSSKVSTFFEQVNFFSTASVSEYIVYGTHLNLEGTLNLETTTNLNLDSANDISLETTSELSLENVEVILKDFDGNEISIDTEYEIENSSISFSTLDKINTGLDLENLESEVYFFLLKLTYSDSSTLYYSLSNSSDYTEDINYYTLTKNNSNNKITISWNTYNELSYFYLTNTAISSLPDDVYDIVIDPGHGGVDTGAVSTDGNYYESELVLEYGLELKELLEDFGLKVLITRDGTESDDINMAYTMYDEDGRVNIANASGAKILISLHMNSNEDFVSSGGVEVYTPNDCDYTFAKLLANNIVDYASTNYSVLDDYKIYNGVYLHTFTESEIAEMARSARLGGYSNYNISTSTPYFYMIRETGGIATNAFVDGRNTNYGTNLYYDSNVGIESYLIELGYISVKSDLKNLLNNQTSYVEAIKDSIISFYNL